MVRSNGITRTHNERGYSSLAAAGGSTVALVIFVTSPWTLDTIFWDTPMLVAISCSLLQLVSRIMTSVDSSLPRFSVSLWVNTPTLMASVLVNGRTRDHPQLHCEYTRWRLRYQPTVAFTIILRYTHDHSPLHLVSLWVNTLLIIYQRFILIYKF